jgi:hypothetical protein
VDKTKTSCHDKPLHFRGGIFARQRRAPRPPLFAKARREIAVAARDAARLTNRQRAITRRGRLAG